MKVFLLFIFCLLLLAENAGAQSVSQLFTITWEYPTLSQTGFRIERQPPGGNFGVVAQLNDPNARTFIDNVTGSPGDIFAYRLVAFDPTQVSPYSNTAAATIPVVTTQPPPAPSVVRVVKNKTQCTFTLAGTPPDVVGGWTVQFRYTSAPSGTTAVFGAADGSEPFSVSTNLKNGSYDFWGTWTKVGQPTLNSGHAAGQCP